jgi:hypothetical protein
VLDRRNETRRSSAGVPTAAGALALRVWSKAARRPVDSFAMLSAGVLSLVIVINALFLQSGPHPSPFFANPTPLPTTGAVRPKGAEPAVSRPSAKSFPAQSNDPIAELIGPSPRILAVQRVLSEFGYGQLKLSGTLDEATSAAIERFERDHKLPITGRVSDRLVSELAAMTGQSVQ